MLYAHSVAPVLVAGNDARGIILVVQVPSAVRIDEHSIGIVHEILSTMTLVTETIPIQGL